MNAPKIDSYDLSRKQQELLEWRHAKRQQLRYEYIKEMLNPMKQTNITDTAIERYAMLRMKHEYATRLYTGRELCIGIGFFSFMVLFGYCLFSYKKAQEHELRSGKVSYAEREYRFF